VSSDSPPNDRSAVLVICELLRWILSTQARTDRLVSLLWPAGASVAFIAALPGLPSILQLGGAGVLLWWAARGRRARALGSATFRRRR
jgi:hypothetical protein